MAGRGSILNHVNQSSAYDGRGPRSYFVFGSGQLTTAVRPDGGLGGVPDPAAVLKAMPLTTVELFCGLVNVGVWRVADVTFRIASLAACPFQNPGPQPLLHASM